MNQANVGLRTVQGQTLQILTDARELKALVKETHLMAVVGSGSPAGPPRRRRAKKPLTRSHPSMIGLKESTTIQEPKTSRLGLANNLGVSMLDIRERNSVRPSSAGILSDFQEDPDFRFGYYDCFPEEYIEMAKDTVRGVLLDYILEDPLLSDLNSKGVLCMNARQVNTIRKHQGIFHARGILRQDVKERQFKRGLGLVTISQTTTKWKASRVGDSFYLETKLHVSLDPKSEPLTRLRLFCVTIFNGTPRYEPKFDPVLKVCNWVHYDAPVVIACRNGDLNQVRTLIASGVASPYDRSQARQDTSLLDVVFRQIIVNLDQPANSLMSRLCMLFTYLVDQGLDPGELNKQHERSASRKQRVPAEKYYIFRCSYCFEEIRGMHYDCKLCSCGDFSLCQRCIEEGQCCMDPKHMLQQPLQDRATMELRTIYKYTPLERLASAYYTTEYAPYLVEIARVILCRSTQDPLRSTNGFFLKWRWYKELLGIESPDLSFISRQQEWIFEWQDETSSYQDYRPNLGIEHLLNDPTAPVLRGYMRAACFDNYREKLTFIGYAWGNLCPFFDRLEYREVVINHISSCLDTDTYFMHGFLLPTLTSL